MLSTNINKKELFVTSAAMLACLVLFYSFPTKGSFQEIMSSLTFLFLVPILYIKLILKKNVSDFGLGMGDYKKGFLWGAISLVFVALFILLLSRFENVSKDYRDLFYVSKYFDLFVMREISFGIAFVLVDFFFRGFVMFYFQNIFQKKYFAIFLQFVMFLALLLLSGKLNWSFATQALLSLSAGIIAFNSKSILYSSFFSWISIIVIELSIMKLFFSN
ncbi:MAG: hypothetical protein OEV93_04155 [Candidatus Moranbacteria bacterium]|nr:hypothetical protein [Candidatus Moranbacteria bacterium]